MLKGQVTANRKLIGLCAFLALAMIAALAVPAAAQGAKAKVDLNTADLKTIAALPGISETLAQRIIDARPFKKLEDLSNVKGIGEAKIAGLKDLVTFSKVKAPKDAASKTESTATTKETTVAEKTKTAKTETAATKEEKELINVNKADLKTLVTLPGVGEALAQRIVDGRPYKTLDDLGKVKGIGEAKLKELKGLIAFEDKTKEKTVKTATTKEATAVSEKTKTTAAEKTKTAETTKAVETATTKTKETAKTVEATPGHVDLNTADLKTLETLPGIGPALAQKIIDARPFKTVADLEKVSGIGEAKMKELKDLVTVGTKASTAKSQLAPGEKLDINTATAEQLDALFGIGPVKSQAIVDYRTANGKFKAIEDIMKVKGIKEGEFAKIKDFIKVK
jgi:competence protein ComEA